MKQISPFRVTRFLAERGRSRREKRRLILERPLTIRIGNVPVRTLLRTPGNDRDLAAGFLLSEGFAKNMGDIFRIAKFPGRGGTLRVSLQRRGKPGMKNPRRAADCVFSPAVLYAVPAKVRTRQRLFRQTGASHAAALFDRRGRILVLREDISRHCALDKVIGWAARSRIDLGTLGIYTTSRIGAVMVAKAARMGVPLLAAVSAVSDAAAKVAKRANVTLAGFVRGKEITLYAHPERIGSEKKGGGSGGER